MSQPKLILFTSKSGNLATYVSMHFSELKPFYVHPDDDIEEVLKYIQAYSTQHKLFGMSVGYTKLIPKNIIDLFGGNLYNTHPGELPLTEGLYGRKVIQKMISSYRQRGVISIHQVDEHYDTGAVVDVLMFPYLESAFEINLLREYEEDAEGIRCDFLHEWIDQYQRMLKLIEPTFVIRFIEQRIRFL